MIKTVIETLSELDDNFSQEALRKACENRYLKKYLLHGYFEEYKFLLPPGVPEYEPKRVEFNEQLNSVTWKACNMFSTLCSNKITEKHRERAFTQLLYSLSEEDCILLLGVKDQTLNCMFPNITKEALVESGLFDEHFANI